MKSNNIIGEKIRKYRKREGWNQKQLAEKLGIINARLSNWELGVTNPDINIVTQLCYLFQVSADDLLGINLDRSPNKLSDTEKELIVSYRHLDPRGQYIIRNLIQSEQTFLNDSQQSTMDNDLPNFYNNNIDDDDDFSRSMAAFPDISNISEEDYIKWVKKNNMDKDNWLAAYGGLTEEKQEIIKDLVRMYQNAEEKEKEEK